MAFFGAGPEGDWYIGIEYKTVDDVVACIKSGRFTGTQLPGMLRTYDMSFLLIEGLALLDHNSGQMAKRVGKTSYPFGLPYRNFDNFLTSVSVHSALAGKPCVVKKSASMNETVHIIRDMFEYFQKPWDKHKSISRPDLTKMQTASYDLEVIKVTPTDPEYPKYVLRKAIFQIDRVGWDLSGKAADHFGTLENAISASRLDWENVFGPVVADRVFRALHGYSDQSSTKTKRVDCDCFVLETISPKTGKQLKVPKKVYNVDCVKCRGSKKYTVEIYTDKYGAVTERILSSC